MILQVELTRIFLLNLYPKAIMEREDKQMEVTLDSLLQRCQDLMKAMSTFLFRIENEQLDYKDYVDAYASFQGYISQLMKVIRNNHQLLTNRSVFPIKLSPMEDEALAAATEGRLKALTHDSCPIYLRTKHEPEIEQRFSQFTARTANINNDQANKQIASANKIVQNVTDLIRTHREESESDLSRSDFPPTTVTADTYALVGAIFLGKNLRPGSEVNKLSAATIAANQAAAAAAALAARATPKPSGPSIKTNIKAASSTIHYNR